MHESNYEAMRYPCLQAPASRPAAAKRTILGLLPLTWHEAARFKAPPREHPCEEPGLRPRSTARTSPAGTADATETPRQGAVSRISFGRSGIDFLYIITLFSAGRLHLGSFIAHAT